MQLWGGRRSIHWELLLLLSWRLLRQLPLQMQWGLQLLPWG